MGTKQFLSVLIHARSDFKHLQYGGTMTVEWSRASVVGTGGLRFESRAQHSFSEEEFKFDCEQFFAIAIPNSKFVSASAGAPQLSLKDLSRKERRNPSQLKQTSRKNKPAVFYNIC